MKSRITSFVLLAAVLLAGSTIRASAAEAPKADAAQLAKLMSAIETSNYEAFIADGEAAFRQLPAPQFAATAAAIGPKLKEGHRLFYLGELNQHGYRVALWKVTYEDGSDDALVSLSLKNGKVGGFWIR